MDADVKTCQSKGACRKNQCWRSCYLVDAMTAFIAAHPDHPAAEPLMPRSRPAIVTIAPELEEWIAA